LDDVSEPPLSDGSVLVRTVALGVCGTDREIVAGEYGFAPPGRDRLILGHESLGEVETAPRDSGLKAGDLVVGIVRRPDPVPCPSCAVGEWDMCRNGKYTERGIKERHGYGAERFRIEPEFAVKIDPKLGFHGVLLEPASIVAKAWDHIERMGARSHGWKPRSLLVIGAGPIGLLAGMMGAQRGLDVHVLDRREVGRKATLVRDLGGTIHADVKSIAEIQADVIMECTGAPQLIRAVFGATAPAGIACLLGVTDPGHDFNLDIGLLNRTLVLNNDVIFGSVNANRRHYQLAADALARTDKAWLDRVITRRVAIEDWAKALERQPEDIKVVVDFAH
jgi:threonine dehydrogenase-like Zn-dependent dehydrogenase